MKNNHTDITRTQTVTIPHVLHAALGGDEMYVPELQVYMLMPLGLNRRDVTYHGLYY